MADRMNELIRQHADRGSTMGNQQSKEGDAMPNRLKKKASHPDIVSQGNKLKNNPSDQPWATAHLTPRTQSMERHPTTHTPASMKRKPVAPTSPPPLVANDPDAITPAPPRFPAIRIDSYEGHSNVTQPAKPPAKYRYSELVDLDSLGPTGHVRSPSGNILSVAEASVRSDRPASIRERQERIQENIRQKMEARGRSALGRETSGEGKREQSSGKIGNETECVGDSKGLGKARKSLKGKVKRVFGCFTAEGGD